MLERLLAEISAGGTFETSTLAAKLETSPAMVEAMLDHLQRLGRLQPYQSCGDGCGGCSLKSTCHSKSRADGVKLWQA
ncbi:MAG: hypothetical protein JW987_17200 [Anaerolineaceae bacterium]|nr:hypothetical protein [Anaerolineaceae bacterium]